MNAKHILFVFLSVVYSSSFIDVNAQQHKIDSLYSVLKNAQADTEKVNTLNRMGYALDVAGSYHAADSLAHQALQLAKAKSFPYGESVADNILGNLCSDQGDFKQALVYYGQSLTICEQNNIKRGIARACGNMGNAYWSQGNYPRAIHYHTRALGIFEELGDKHGTVRVYLNLGNINTQNGNYPVGLSNYLQALKIAADIKDSEDMANTYNGMGNLYAAQLNYKEALTYQQKCLDIYKRMGYKQGIGFALSNIGVDYSDLGNNDEALNYQMQALKIDEEIGNKPGTYVAEEAIGRVYSVMKNYTEALAHTFKALAIAKETGDEAGISSVFGNIGSYYRMEHNNALAQKYLDSALALARKNNYKDELQTIYLDMSELDSAVGNHKAAFEHYKKYIVYHDSLTNDENTRKLVQEQMQYEFDKQQTEQKAAQDKKDAVAASDKHKQKILTITISMGLALVLLFSGLLFSRFRITQRQKKIIEEQKGIVEEKNKDILDSITYAKRLQDAILPPLSEIEKHLPESFVLYKPKDIVAGDFYWMEKVDDTILIAACDCTGHGVPGAMVSVVCSNAVNRAVKEFKLRDTGVVLDKVRELVLETFQKSEGDVKDGMDCSFAAINTKTGIVEWSGAYNPLWYIESGEMKEIAGDKQPIGKVDNPRPFPTHLLTLKKGDSLYLFTDGYADQFGGPKGKKFKYQQLLQLIMDNAQLTMKEQKQMLEKQLASWQGNLEQVDDILIIGIKV